MAATPLSIIQLPSGYAAAPVAAPFTAGDNSQGNSFVNTGREILEVLNGAAAVNAVITLTSAGPMTAGNFTLAFTIGGVVFTTANIAWNATAAQVAAAVLAATAPGGSTLAQCYPQGTVTGGGGPANTVGSPITLTFAGAGTPLAASASAVAGVAGIGTTGFAGYAVQAPTVNNAGVTGGTEASSITTPGTGLLHYTVVSTPDTPEQRTRDEGPIAVGPGQNVVTQMFPELGWSASGLTTLTCDSASVTFRVVRVPLF